MPYALEKVRSITKFSRSCTQGYVAVAGIVCIRFIDDTQTVGQLVEQARHFHVAA